MKKSQLFSFSSFLKSLGLIACLVLVNTATFAQDGANDPTFNPDDVGFSNGDGVNGKVNTTAIQSDGKIIIGGYFNIYNGTEGKNIARLNADGTLDETFIVGTGANIQVYTIAIQSDGKIIIGGDFTSYNGTAINRIARLNFDGTLDETFTVGTGASSEVHTIAIQGDGKIIIGGWFSSYNGTTRIHIARLNTDGTLDETFTTGSSGADNLVRTTAIQSDGRIIVGGDFYSLSGTGGRGIGRLKTDGTLDGTFNVGTGVWGSVHATAIQSDGKIIIGGSFTSYNGAEINCIARLNINGTLDETFALGTGANWTIKTIAIQSDGKIIIGGNFTSYNGAARNHIARLNPDGTLDQTFTVGTGANEVISTTSIQNDEKIIIGGDFTFYNGIPNNRISRLNVDGTLDETFNKSTGANEGIYASAIQSDGKIIICGNFTSYNGTPINRIARLNTDGTLDGTFSVGTGADSWIKTTAIQIDGKIIIGGNFHFFNGIPTSHIARLNSDGTLDETFNVGTGANNIVWVIAIQGDGKIIIGGMFTSYNDEAAYRIARLNIEGSLDESFMGTGTNDNVYTTAIQSDGKIIIGGNFTNYNGTAINRIACLNADGSLDQTFTVGTGASDRIQKVAIQEDGKIIIGGLFTSFNGIAKKYIARLNTDGTLDEIFALGMGTNSGVGAISIQHDGKIIIGGGFTSYNGTVINRIARLNSDGSFDETFEVGVGANGYVYTTAIQSDEKIIVVGDFTSYNGVGRNRIARILNTIGTSLPQIAESEVMVYPNPTNGKTNVDLGEYCQSANVEVFDICGKLVMQKQYNNTQILDIDITAPAGIYFVTITTANKRETLKLIKN